MSEELRPCPFCGGEAAYTQILGNYERPHEVYCSTCDGGITEGRSKDGVIHNWNNRPIEDAFQARIAELEAAQRWIRTKVKLPDRAVRQFYEVVCLHQDFAELALFSKGRWIIYDGTSVYDITDRVVFWRRRQPLPAEVMDVLNKRQELQ